MEKAFNSRPKKQALSLMIVVMLLFSLFSTSLTVPAMADELDNVADTQADEPDVNLSGDKPEAGSSVAEFVTGSLGAEQDLIVNVGANTSELNFNWYCGDEVSGTPSVQIAEGTTFSGIQGAVTTFTGIQGDAEAGSKWNKVTVTGLKPGTEYACRISSDGINYSGTYTFKTTEADKYTFAAVGDPQLGCSGEETDNDIQADAIAWDTTVKEIIGKGADFIAGTGDQIENAKQGATNIAIKQKEYTGFAKGLAQNGRIIPFASVMGNHEADGQTASGDGRNMYGYHYNVPNGATEVVNGFKLNNYYYLYNNILFVVLDTAPYPKTAEDAKPFINAFDKELEEATEANAGEYDWLVVQTHKNQQSNASHWNDPDIKAYSQAGFEDLMTKYKVDLALTGHDHSYTRTYPFKSNYTTLGTGGPLTDGGVTIDEGNQGDELIKPDGTVYMMLNSSTGSKYYALQPEKKATSKVEYQANKPEYTIIQAEGGKLTIKTYEVSAAEPIDSFSIAKGVDDLIVNVGTDTSELNFNWYCDTTVSGTPSVKIEGVATTFTGIQGDAETGRKWNKVTVTGLKPGTEYVCRISSDGTNYSGPYTFKTTAGGKFTFAAVGDPQLGCTKPTDTDASIQADANAWDATVKEIIGKGADFIAGTGDQIENAKQGATNIEIKQKEYTGFAKGLVQNGRIIPFASVMGNHEADGSMASGDGRNMYGYHYNLPNIAEDVVNGFKLNNYYYMYNNILFVVLDTAPYPTDAESAKPYIDAFDRVLEEATEANAGEYDWLVVQTHKNQQSNASHWNDEDINAYSQAGFEDLMTKYDVDLALTGHDHSYTRTYPFKSNYTEVGMGGPLAEGGITIDEGNKGNEIVNPDGTVYMMLNSSTGSKYYALQLEKKATSNVEYQANKPEYTIIQVENGKLSIKTYEVSAASPIDSFSIAKGESDSDDDDDKNDKDDDNSDKESKGSSSYDDSTGSGNSYIPISGARVKLKPGIRVKEAIKGYISGYGDGTFRPNNKITREETAQLLFNILDLSGGASNFTDVGFSWYTGAINSLTSRGIFKGRPDGSFGVGDYITRQDFAIALANIFVLDVPGESGTGTNFSDMEGAYGKDAVQKLAGLGVINGYEDGTFRPTAPITRAEAVVILNRLFSGSVEKSQGNFNDISGHWAEEEIRNAAK